MSERASKLRRLNTTPLRFILTKADKSPDIIIHYCSDIRIVIYSVNILKFLTAARVLAPEILFIILVQVSLNDGGNLRSHDWQFPNGRLAC